MIDGARLMGKSARKLTVLIFHSVLDEPDPLRPFEIDRKTFARQLRGLRRWHNVVSLRDGLQLLADEALPRSAVAITFDDGYRNNLTNAIPLLSSFGMEATIYVATHFVDGGMMFNDLIVEAVRNCRSGKIPIPGTDESVELDDGIASRLSAINRILEQVKYFPIEARQELAEQMARRYGVEEDGRIMMSSDEIRLARKSGIEIGAHTVRHPILANLEDAEANSEIVSSKNRLESILDEQVVGFAYPNGKFGRDFGDRDAELVQKAGFQYAVTTDWAVTANDTNRFKVPRISIGLRSGWRSAATIFKAAL